MRQQSIFITLGIVQIIILTLVGLYFYRLKQNSLSQDVEEIIEVHGGQNE